MSPVPHEFRQLLVVALIGPPHFPLIPTNDSAGEAMIWLW